MPDDLSSVLEPVRDAPEHLPLEPATDTLPLEPVSDAHLPLEPIHDPSTTRDPANFIGESINRELTGIEPGSFNAAFKPFAPISNPFAAERNSALGPLLVAAGAENFRKGAEHVADKIIKPLEALESPGGLMLGAATLAAPAIGMPIGAALSAPAAVEGAKELVQGVKEGSISKMAGGAVETAIGVLPTVLAARGGAKAAADTIPGAAEKLAKARQDIATYTANGSVRDAMTVGKDAADNSANIFARQVANDVRQPLERTFEGTSDTAKNALTFAVEAKGNKAALDQMSQTLVESTKADPAAKTTALEAINYARDNWDSLEPLVKRYNDITSAQVDSENTAGIDTLKREGYVMHAQDIESEGDVFGSSRGSGEPTGFRKVRTHDTYADSIANGIEPHTLDSTALLESRLRYGQRLINNRAWIDGLRSMQDVNGNAIGTDPVTITRQNGTTYQDAPPGYHMEYAGRQPVAIRNGFDGIFHALTDPSAWSRNAAGRMFMSANAASKSVSLMLDTFHLGRVAFWDGLIKAAGLKTFEPPFPSYSKGATLLDYTTDQIREMAARGEVPKTWEPDLLESKRRLDLAVKTGYNVGRIADSLHQEWIQHMPVLGTFNRWLFDQFQRGAMTESWLLEYERLRRARPEMIEPDAARQVSQDLNTRFGNLGRQGLFKSRTAQDTARALALAPQWNEGLIRTELGAVKQAGQFALDTAQGKRLYMGVLGRSVLGMAALQFSANQLINYATRGHPTWQNPEEGWGAKLSAWIPDYIGHGPGFFLHPLGLAAEITHLLSKSYERSGDVRKTILDFARSRSSAAMRPVMSFVTNTDFLGRTLKPGTVWGEMAKSAIPVPIAGGAAVNAAKQLATGQHSEAFPGQFQKQLMSSVGVKTDQAPSPEQRMRNLASDFKDKHGIARGGDSTPSDYQPLVDALRRGNQSDAQKALQDLLDSGKARKAIIQHFTEWPHAAYTGKTSTEGQFTSTLTPEQRQQYQQARSDRHAIANAAKQLLQKTPMAAKK